METIMIKGLVRGVCVALLLMAIGLGVKDKQWWIAMLSLSIALGI